jgi:hypothetical protein
MIIIIMKRTKEEKNTVHTRRRRKKQTRKFSNHTLYSLGEQIESNHRQQQRENKKIKTNKQLRIQPISYVIQ